MPREISTGPHHVRPFLASDGAVRSTEFIGLPGFDLDEDQRVAVPSDQVNLACPRPEAVIPGDHDDTGTLQVPMGNIFAAAPQGVIGCHVALAAAVSQAIGEPVKEV